MRCLQHDKFVVMVLFIRAIVDKKISVNLQNQREEKRSFFYSIYLLHKQVANEMLTA